MVEGSRYRPSDPSLSLGGIAIWSTIQADSMPAESANLRISAIVSGEDCGPITRILIPIFTVKCYL